MEVNEIRKRIIVMEEELGAIIKNFEKTTGTYISDIFIQRKQAGKPWLLRVGTVVSVDDPFEYKTS